MTIAAQEIKELVTQLSPPELKKVIYSLSEDEADCILHDWELWGRKEQFEPPGDWQYWLILAGRGWGKTRCGAEWVREKIKTHRYVNLIGATSDDARDIMIQGDSGILSCCSKADRPRYIANQSCLKWPNGAISLVFTAAEPERLRGKQSEAIWCDELAAWRYAQEAWQQAMLGLRLGNNPRAIVTTTPRPTALVKKLIADSSTHVTRGTTYDNRDNLAATFFSAIIKSYEGTRLGRQELNAEILEDNPNALWTRSNIDMLRVRRPPDTLKRVVVAVDPAVTSNENSDETGIIVAALAIDDQAYILDDRTLLASPDSWARAAVKAYYDYGADRIFAEINNGGDLVEAVIRTIDRNVSYSKVRASRGKAIRAEPIAALYEQGRVHHVGFFAKLEDQMCDFDPINPPAKSPDRMDALVWALTGLFESSGLAFASI